MANIIFVGNLLCATFMAGVIWYVQIVHYPLFALVGKSDFLAYHAAHSTRTTFVVAAPMVGEIGLSLLLLAVRPAYVSAAVAWVAGALTLVTWGATFALAVPSHTLLGGGWDRAVIVALVSRNWVRTAAWSARAVLLGVTCAIVLPVT